MYIRNRLAAGIYRVVIGMLGSLGAWFCSDNFGETAWRGFAIYVLFASSAYFTVLGIMDFWSWKTNRAHPNCAMLEGAFLVNFVLISATAIATTKMKSLHLNLAGGEAALVYGTLPIMILIDYLAFFPKGKIRPMMPFYWLSFSTIYFGAVMLSANMASKDFPWRYPLAFMDYMNLGIYQFLDWLVFLGILILIFGYVIYAFDALVSGKVGKYIVLPKIKVVEVDAENYSKNRKK